ncbi:sensor histidine kinase [Priestia endophytica]|uniref:sensor histidine kinase n=1 Tax=Priestia endophytica TaxID=135735 RepID=UPI000F534403|nr:ATP-binding protein [Priestia endophytica]MED4072945.1 histidine kinase [Priestia endophytica]RPK12623.1 hypothetical protein FH5_02829 [Priestia endophytica]
MKHFTKNSLQEWVGVIFPFLLMNIFLYILFKDILTIQNYMLLVLMGTILLIWYSVMIGRKVKKVETLFKEESKYGKSLFGFLEKGYKENNMENLMHILKNEISSVLNIQNVYVCHYCEEEKVFKTEDDVIADVEHIDLADTYFEVGKLQNIPTGYLLLVGKYRSFSLFIYLKHSKKKIELSYYDVGWLNRMALYTCMTLQTFMLTKDFVKEIEGYELRANHSPFLSKLVFFLSENERIKLSQDIHDTILQELIFMVRELEKDSPTQHQIQKIRGKILENIQQIRETCYELRPPFLLEMGLIGSIQNLVSKHQEKGNCSIEFLHNLAGEEQISEEITVNLYRIAQELLNNARKHSQAKFIVLSLYKKGSTLLFLYEDDGIGMDMSEHKGEREHFGIKTIRERTHSLNGKFDLSSSIGEGMLIKVELSIQRNTKTIVEDLIYDKDTVS